MTEKEAIAKVLETLKRIQQDVDTITQLMYNAMISEDPDQNETAEFIAKIGEDWEDELTDAKTLLQMTKEMNRSSEVITFEDDPGNTP